MPGAGFEPARSFEQRLLRPQSLPVPPPGRAARMVGARRGRAAKLQQLCANRKRRTLARSWSASVRSQEEVERVLRLAGQGLSQSEIARRTGIPRLTVSGWVRGKLPRRSPLHGAGPPRLQLSARDVPRRRAPDALPAHAAPPDLPRQPVSRNHRGVRPGDPSRDAAQQRGGLPPPSPQRGPRGLLLATVVIAAASARIGPQAHAVDRARRTGSARSRTSIPRCSSAG